jgi:hypothetical protein
MRNSHIEGLEPKAIEGFDGVRAYDGFPSVAFQEAFDETARKFAERDVAVDGTRHFDMLVLSSGGVNGAFGAGVLTSWTKRGDRPEFWIVTGVSVGALMAPFVFAGPQFDERIEELFRSRKPSDLHREKGVISSVLWDESLADNQPLVDLITEGMDEDLMNAMADRHEEGRRCWVGSTNMDIGQFCVWDLGAIATRRSPEALELMRQVLTASAAIPVVYPPVRFESEEGSELHSDGAVTRPMFLPNNVFDAKVSVERAGLDWAEIKRRMFVIHNGCMRPSPATLQRDTLAIATRTVLMMSYTMAAEHVLHLYLLSRAWGAEFQFHTMPPGQELELTTFKPEDTDRLFVLGQGLMEREEPWLDSPPGYVLGPDLERIRPVDTESQRAGGPVAAAATPEEPKLDVDVAGHLQRIAVQIQKLQDTVQKLCERQDAAEKAAAEQAAGEGANGEKAADGKAAGEKAADQKAAGEEGGAQKPGKGNGGKGKGGSDG